MLEGAAEIAVGVENDLFAADLVLGVGSDFQIDLLDLVEAVGDIAARRLHPDVAETLPGGNLPVGELVHHRLGVLADGVEALGDLLVALAHVHRRDLLAHDLVEEGCLGQRARDGDDLVLVEGGNLVQQRHDRLLGAVRLGEDPDIAQHGHGAVEILHRRIEYDRGFVCHVRIVLPYRLNLFIWLTTVLAGRQYIYARIAPRATSGRKNRDNSDPRGDDSPLRRPNLDSNCDTVTTCGEPRAMHLAQLNIARLRYDRDDPRLRAFMRSLDAVNAIARAHARIRVALRR